MNDRLRMVVAGVVVVLLALVVWKALVAPARDDAATARDAQAAAESEALTVSSRLGEARAAAERTPGNVRMLKRLAVAVPQKVEAPALIDQLDRTAKRHDVSFDVLKVSDGAASASAGTGAGSGGGTAGDTADGSAADGGGAAAGGSGGSSTTSGAASGTGGGASGTAAGASSSAGGAAGTAAGDAGAAAAPGSVPVALTVEIAGRYVDVARFVQAVQADVAAGRSGALRAKGRLLRVNAIDLTTDAADADRRLEGTLDVVAYLLPAEAEAAAAASGTPSAGGGASSAGGAPSGGGSSAGGASPAAGASSGASTGSQP